MATLRKRVSEPMSTTSPTKELPHPYDAQERPLSWLQRLLLLPFLPWLGILFFFRMCIFVCAVIALAAVCALSLVGRPEASTANFEPLRGVRRYLTKIAAWFLGRIMLLTFGVWPGMLSVRGKWDPTCPVMVAAPHAGSVDGFIFFVLDLPRPVILEPYSKIPFVRQILQACGALLVPLARSDAKQQAPTEKDKGSSSLTNVVREKITGHKRSFVPAPDAAPICVFSEGITHSGCAVLPFFPGAFEGGSPVQPVVVRYPFTHYNAHAFLTSLVNHFGRLFITPWMFIEVEYLPTVHPSADEASSGQLMADRVRAAIGAASGLPLHPLGARDLRKEMKKAEELAKAAKAAEAARKAGKQIDAPLL